MSEIEQHALVEGGALPGERQETAEPAADASTHAKPAGLCHHAMESGLYCQSPALRDRRYCYSHLRLRGQRLRMARAIAKRLPYRLLLPALDDIAGVRVAVAQVADALAAGLLEPQRAGRLVYAFQNITTALRWEAQAHKELALQNEAQAAAPLLPAGAPPFAPSLGERVGGGGDQRRLVEEYPEFEAEFELPAGLDLSQPPHVLFPPEKQTGPAAAGNAAAVARAVASNHPRPSYHLWTKESIELEELEKRRASMDEKRFCEQSSKIHGRIEKQVKTEMRKEREAEWQAEADRRNAAEEERDRQYAGMDDGQRNAFHLGVLRGLQAAQEQAEEEARKKPVKTAVVSG